MSRLLLAAWEETVRRDGERCALIQASTGERISFRDLDGRASAWVERHCTELAALAGRAVVFALPNGVRWFEVMLGLAKARAIAVPLDSAEPLAAQHQVARSLRAGAYWGNDRLVAVSPSTAKRFRSPSTCLIKLTSGSTGVPRPLAFTDTELIADARQVMTTMTLTSSDLNYALIPFGHSYGLGNLTLPLIVAGIPAVCGTSPLPHAIAADFAAWRPTVFPGVPAVFRGLAATEGVALESLRVALSAGSPLPVEVAQAFLRRFGKRLHSFYGSSETGGISYDRDGEGALAGSVGTAMDGVTLSFLLGQRLRVASAAVFSLGNDRRAHGQAAFVMADRVAADEHGRLTLLGRRGTTVKIAGRRVELGEVTARMRTLAGVSDVWVGVSTGADPVLGAAVASTRGAGELRAELLAGMPVWKVPKKWLVLSALPLSQRGKIDTAALKSKLFGSAKQATL